jgi:Phage Mu protein F like protein
MATSNTAASASSGQAFGFGTPFVEQLDFFLKKLALPSERWDDIQKSAHDRAFIVAGASKADLLNDLQAAIGKRIADGKGLEAFRTEFADIVKKHGWTGWTGEGTKAGEAWRTRIIYSTNMSTSYAAGRWQQLNDPALLKLRPYWQYKHSDSVAHPRPHHKAWNGITLPYDHPFWKTHFAPNGWLCHCRIIAVDEATYLQALAEGKGVPPEGWDTLDPKTGAPLGIDKGFDYAPGRTWHPALDKYPFEIARQIVADNLQDGIFERWTDKLSKLVEAAKVLPEYQGLKGSDLSIALRKLLARGEKIPVAVLDERAKSLLGTDSQTVWLSDDTLIKQALHREGQALPDGHYFRLQEAIDAAEYIENKQGEKLIYYHKDGDVLVAVIKAAKEKNGSKKVDNWLVSLRRSRPNELEAAISAGRALKW